MPQLLFFCICLSLIASVGGCGKPNWHLALVEGKISRAGSPLAGVQVVFLPDPDATTHGPRASAFTNEAGHYELRTDAGDRGAVVGRYRVCLLAPSSEDMRENKESNMPRKMSRLYPDDKAKEHPSLDQVPLDYRFFDKTPLRAEVRTGPQTIDFNVP